MSRVIKFRAWSSVDKIMLCSEVVMPSFGVILESENHDVMQFTGLTDKNGVEIYEGDIVECDEYFYYQISWSEKHACWYASDCGGLDDLPCVQVIGNIYQNPDLLNK